MLTTRPPACSSATADKAASISLGVLACRTCARSPRRRAASWKALLSRSGWDGLVGLISRATIAAAGSKSCKSSSLFPINSVPNSATPGNVATGSAKAGNNAGPHGVDTQIEDNRNCRGCRLARECRRHVLCDDHAHLTTNQIGRQSRQAIVLALSPTVFDRHIPAFDIAGFLQAPLEGDETTGNVVGLRGSDAEIAYDGHRLLAASGNRPCDGGTAEQDRNVAPPHSMTSSARARIEGGTVSPSALAVLSLTTSSNVVGCWTGISAGFSPLRTLPA